MLKLSITGPHGRVEKANCWWCYHKKAQNHTGYHSPAESWRVAYRCLATNAGSAKAYSQANNRSHWHSVECNRSCSTECPAASISSNARTNHGLPELPAKPYIGALGGRAEALRGRQAGATVGTGISARPPLSTGIHPNTYHWALGCRSKALWGCPEGAALGTSSCSAWDL